MGPALTTCSACWTAVTAPRRHQSRGARLAGPDLRQRGQLQHEYPSVCVIRGHQVGQKRPSRFVFDCQYVRETARYPVKGQRARSQALVIIPIARRCWRQVLRKHGSERFEMVEMGCSWQDLFVRDPRKQCKGPLQ